MASMAPVKCGVCGMLKPPDSGCPGCEASQRMPSRRRWFGLLACLAGVFVVCVPTIAIVVPIAMRGNLSPGLLSIFFTMVILVPVATCLVWHRSREPTPKKEPMPGEPEREYRRAQADRRISTAVVALTALGAFIFGLAKACTWTEARYSQWKLDQAMNDCGANLRADLVEYWGLTKDPTVTKCVGQPEKATCFVHWLRGGAYVTEPLVGDCSRRYLETGIRDEAAHSEAVRKRFEVQATSFTNAIHASH